MTKRRTRARKEERKNRSLCTMSCNYVTRKENTSLGHTHMSHWICTKRETKRGIQRTSAKMQKRIKGDPE
ncbi:hypothetical protein ACS0PU_005463 [Formica fusca]